MVRRPEHWNVVVVMNLLFDVCSNDASDDRYLEMDRFAAEIDEMFDSLEIYNSSVNAAANETIMSRLIAFNGSKRENPPN